MHSVFFLTLSAAATLVAARDNAFNIPNGGYVFTAGEPTTLTWDPTTQGTVTLKLQSGNAFDSSTGTTIVSGIDNSGSYTWDVPSDIADQTDYTVEIVSDSDPNSSNYLPRFSVEGAEATPTTESTTTTAETSTTESSSTSTETTLTTTTAETTTTESSSSPSPTPTTTSAESSSATPTSTTSTESSTSSTESSENPSDSPTSIPSVNEEDGDNAGMSNRVSGSMLALVLGVAALI